MSLKLDDVTFTGPALPDPYVEFELEKDLNKHRLLPKTTGEEGKELKQRWTAYRRKLRDLVSRGGQRRVLNHVIEPLVELLGYTSINQADRVNTREGNEEGGFLLEAGDGGRLRVWATGLEEDLDAPSKRGAAYRFSYCRIAERVLLASGERVGLLTNGVELRILLSDPARPDSQIVLSIDPNWKRSTDIPDSFLLLLSLASPDGVKAVPEIVDKARLQQSRVTKELRVQARRAVERFVQGVLDHPGNQEKLAAYEDRQTLAKDLWREGLITVYRLLFALKLESFDDKARAFSFTGTTLWRNTFSPSTALAPFVRRIRDEGAETGTLLEDGLRVMFRMFAEGMECTELRIAPLGGALFGADATPILSSLVWGEDACAHLLDQLLWTQKKKGGKERVHYGPLDVEDLGRVYEALLELEPGIATETMCRLRRSKLEVVVPIAQGEKYRPATEPADAGDTDDDADDDNTDTDDEEDTPKRGKKTKVEWIEAIPLARFYLRVGLGRKATGSYYTPHSFVRFLVQETLGPQVEERSPKENPQPGEILKLKVLDPAMGSGHFLVEACRYLGEALYESVRLCDELATKAEGAAERAKDGTKKTEALKQAEEFRRRIVDLPDPDDELLRYLPSRAPEGEESGLSQSRAMALCRRLVAVHCLYGVDKNPLAVELAKLSLWLESHAEGMPLTFLDHRLLLGDSLTGPFWFDLMKLPGSQTMIEDLFSQGIYPKFETALRDAIRHVTHLESSIGTSVADNQEKKRRKAELDRALLPFRAIAAAWSGGVMLGTEKCDDRAYTNLLRSVAETGDLPERIQDNISLCSMLETGLGLKPGVLPLGRSELYSAMNENTAIPSLAYDFSFPEVFYRTGVPQRRDGFDAVIGNPPWERIEIDPTHFFGELDFQVIETGSDDEKQSIIASLRENPAINNRWSSIIDRVEQESSAHATQYSNQVADVSGQKTIGRPDTYRLFVERFTQLAAKSRFMGWLTPSSFHANEGATGIRQLYLEKMKMLCCFSFENRKKLFEIDSRFKFCVVVASKGGTTSHFPCAFYLHDDEWLFKEVKSDRLVTLDPETIRLTGGSHLTFVESVSQRSLDLIVTLFRAKATEWGTHLAECGIKTAFGVELHRNAKFNRSIGKPLPTSQTSKRFAESRWKELPIHAGKTVFQYTDEWDTFCSKSVRTRDAIRSRHWQRSVTSFRFAFRMKAASTNERTFVAVILTPGFVCEQTLAVETDPLLRPNSNILNILGLANTYIFDWQVRQRVNTSLSNYILAPIPVPRLGKVQINLVHSALRLSCNHEGYAPLWKEQVGDAWREPDKKPFTWPVLETDDERWEVRAAIDAVVADAYGLSRDQYAHVLSTFSHKSYPKAPELCLARFDELQSIGLEAFTKKHDPYWDIPLNENLPEPVIDLPQVEDLEDDSDESPTGALFPGIQASPKRSRGSGRRRGGK